MKTKLSKFEIMLGSNTDNIRETRVKLIVDQTRNALKRYVSDLEDTITTKKLELDRILDLAPDTTDSLRPGGKNFDPKAFVEMCIKLRQEIKILEDIDLKEAKSFEKDMFDPLEEKE